jgi:hypothetical protein
MPTATAARVGRLAAAAAVAALMLALALAGTGEADLRKAEKTKYSVRQLLTIQYSTKFCDRSGDRRFNFAYKVNNWSRRWRRRSTRREVPEATFLAQALGVRCDGAPFKKEVESSLQPCFGCEGYSRRWTPDYQGSPGWPYLYTADQPDVYPLWGLRFKLTGTVARRSGRELGEICTTVTLFGSVPEC